MNLQRNRAFIELGGQNISNYPCSPLSSIQSPIKTIPPLPSREVIQSTHRLPLKLSPTKNLHDHLRKKSGVFQNDTSRTDLNQSKLSIKSRVGELRSLLGDRSNINMTSPSKIKISYQDSSRNSSANSKASSHPKQIIQTPTKASVAKIPSREIQLQRKLKILENRIGELHREKQEVVAKLNEENRKIYHENTSLKLKINQLNRRLQKSETFQSSSKIERTESIYKTQGLEKTQFQVAHLKKQIKQLEVEFTSQTTELNNQISANKDLSAELTRVMTICSNQKEQLALKDETINQQKIQLSHFQENSIVLNNQLEQQRNSKQNQEKELTSIKVQMEQNEQRYSTILKEYQGKIEEYQNAYNQNQCLIKQLEEQLKVYEENLPIEEEVLEESEVHHNDFSNECQELQNNFTQAIKEREELIINIRNHNQNLEEKIINLEQSIQLLTLQEEEKTKKLENASLLLEKMTERFQEISQRYTQLTEKYEVEKSKMNKSQGFQGRCKKCDQLLKTVLRLNTQLNPKKAC